jgi:cytidine deaminase
VREATRPAPDLPAPGRPASGSVAGLDALDPLDRELVEAAADVLRRNFEVGRHHVGAAIRARDGRIWTGVHMGSPRIDVCAEEITLGAALSAGERRFEAVASVIMMTADDEPTVTSPCGVCREVLASYEPGIRVVYLDGGRVLVAPVHELLPGAWVIPGAPSPAAVAERRAADRDR